MRTWWGLVNRNGALVSLVLVMLGIVCVVPVNGLVSVTSHVVVSVTVWWGDSFCHECVCTMPG